MVVPDGSSGTSKRPSATPAIAAAVGLRRDHLHEHHSHVRAGRSDGNDGGASRDRGFRRERPLPLTLSVTNANGALPVCFVRVKDSLVSNFLDILCYLQIFTAFVPTH